MIYPRTFVISLADATDRRARIVKIMNDIGLPFEFFDAVDGRGFDVMTHPLYSPLKRLYRYGKHMTGGELGCTLSHRELCQKIVNETIDQALIFEDDVILRDGFLDIVLQIQQMDFSYDMIRFFGSPKLERLKMRTICRIKGEHFLTRHSGMPGGTHAALITQSGAQKIIRHTEKNACPIDALLGRSWQTKINWYTVRPGIAAQDLSFHSSIEEERVKKKKDISGLQKFIYPFSRAWFKLSETFGKKYWYYKSWFQDQNIRKKYHG